VLRDTMLFREVMTSHVN